MQFSSSQYRKIEHQFLQQFQLKTLDFYDKNPNPNNVIEYKNILNELKTRKQLNFSKKKSFTLKLEQHNRQNSYDFSVLKQKKSQTSDSKIQQQQVQEQQQQFGFYLTQKIPSIKTQRQNSKNTARTVNDDKKSQQLTKNDHLESNKPYHNNLNSTILQTSRHNQLPLSSNILGLSTNNNNQNLSIEHLQDKISTQNGVLECLKHEQTQVESAILLFKKRIIALQNTLNSQELKQKEVQKIFSQKYNQMILAKHTTTQLKTQYQKTKKHFQLDFDGKKQLQQKGNSKNKQQFSQSIVNYIYLKKMQAKLSQQTEQLEQLIDYRGQLQKKQQKYKQIYQKEDQLYQAFDSIKQFIQEFTIIERQSVKTNPIVSILDKNFQTSDDQLKKSEIDESKKRKYKTRNSIQAINLIQQYQSKTYTNRISPFASPKNKYDSQTHFPLIKKFETAGDLYLVNKQLKNIVKQLIDLYRQQKQQTITLISQFQMLINERDQKQTEFHRFLQKMLEYHENLSIQDTIKYNLNKTHFHHLYEQNELQLTKMTKKINILNLSIYSIKDRLKFYLTKQFGNLQKIINNWLKDDFSSKEFITSLMDKLHQLFFTRISPLRQSTNFGKPYQDHSIKTQEKQICTAQTKVLLISFFENWQKYLGFIEIFHENSYVYRYLNKNKLFKLYKRIIKTKTKYPKLRTSDIFVKATEQVFLNARNEVTERIDSLLGLFKVYHSYLQQINKGNVFLNVAFNYDGICTEEHELHSAEISKAPSKNELFAETVRISSVQRASFELNPIIMQKQKSFPLQLEKIHRSNDHRSNDINIISQLKKTKPIPQTISLNIHQLYQDLRSQIQKVKLTY